MPTPSNPELLDPFEVADRLEQLGGAMKSWYPEWRDGQERVEAALRPLLALFIRPGTPPPAHEQAEVWLAVGAELRAAGLGEYPAEVLAHRGVPEQAKPTEDDFHVYAVWALFKSAAADDGDGVGFWLTRAERLFQPELGKFRAELTDACDALLRKWFLNTLPEFSGRVGTEATRLRLTKAQLAGLPRLSDDWTEQVAYGSWVRSWNLGINMVGGEVKVRPTEVATEFRQAAAVPQPPPPDPPPAALAEEPPGGFPHHEDYLPPGMNHPFAAVWPAAARQFGEFRRCLDVADRKLPVGSRLPDPLRYWWVREWAHALLFRTLPCRTVTDIRALYEFGRRLDDLLHVSTARPDTVHPRNVEFTFYDRPLLAADGHGNSRPEPLAGFGRLMERQAGFRPTPFPRSPEPPAAVAPRLCCEEFLSWAWFLATSDPLTPEQFDELSHVGWDDVGANEPGWCRAGGTHREQCRPFAGALADRFRDAIRRVSDANRVAVRPIPEGVSLAVVLDEVSIWLDGPPVSALEARENPPVVPRAVAVERSTPDPDGTVYPTPPDVELPDGFHFGVRVQSLHLIWETPDGRRAWACDGAIASGAMPDPIRRALGVSSWPLALFPVSRSAPVLRRWAEYCQHAGDLLAAEPLVGHPVYDWLRTLRAMRELCAAVGVPGCNEERLAAPLPVDRAAGLRELTALADALVRHADHPPPTVAGLPAPLSVSPAAPAPGGHIPEADEPDGSELDEREARILIEMHAMGATFERNRETQEAIVGRCQRKANRQTWKRTFAGLREAGYIASKVGPSGGCWLTPLGIRTAERLRNES